MSAKFQASTRRPIPHVKMPLIRPIAQSHLHNLVKMYFGNPFCLYPCLGAREGFGLCHTPTSERSYSASLLNRNLTV